MSRHCISWNYEALWGVNNEMWVCVCVWPAPVCPTIGPQLVSEPSTVQTCDTQLWSATHCHIQNGGCVLHHRPNIPLLINCSRYCIGHETASIFKYMNHEDFSHQKTLHRMPIRHAPKNKAISNVSFPFDDILLWSSCNLKIYTPFSILYLLGFRCLKVFVHVAI